ncbi:MAG: hypothetical protein Q7J65_08775 [Candidatus Marinimicrobia bacterium]|nr:hypothetical protein [Candidatus Neomarinimicrobiota bacterium]
MPSCKTTAKLTKNLATTIIAALLLTSCPEEPKPEPEPNYDIFLSVEDFLCIWVTLKVTIPDSGNINYFMIKREGKEIINTTLLNEDTLITDTDLRPDTDYTYRAYFLKGSTVKDSSDELTVHTLPTTSHDFTWEIDRIGVHPTHFNDVQIISENDVWAVGDIRLEDTYTYDSAGVWQRPYSAAHWDGKEWKLFRFIDDYYGIPIRPEGFQYFSDSSLWFASGSILHFDGDTTKLMWTQNYSAGEFLYRVWGSSESDIWFVGSEGLIVHYDGKTFSRISTNNTIRYVDVEGTPDGKHVFVVGHNLKVPYECCVWHIDDGKMDMIYYTEKSAPTNGKYGEVMSVGVYDHCAYFQTAAGLWVYDFLSNSSEIIPSTKNEAVSSIIAQDRNDIFGFGSIWVHFNGENWITNNELFWDITWPKADFKGNFVVAGGISRDASQGVIIRGYR